MRNDREGCKEPGDGGSHRQAQVGKTPGGIATTMCAGEVGRPALPIVPI